MPLRTGLLTPIAGPNPAGASLRYDPLYLQLAEARREDDGLPKGDWEQKPKRADWAQVVALAADALATRSKDLQLAAWLTEALLRTEGLVGLRTGLDLLRALTEQFWEHLYPEVDGDDTEVRAKPLHWVGRQLGDAVRALPIDGAGHDLLHYRESRRVPYEKDCGAQTRQLEERERALAAGRLVPEDVDRAVARTPLEWYAELLAELETCLAALAALDEVARARFASAPSFVPLREALEEIRQLAQKLYEEKGGAPSTPDVQPGAPLPPQDQPGADRRDGSPVDTSPNASVASPSTPPRTEPAGRDDAIEQIVAAAHVLRRAQPTSPAPYLTLRGLRWGELRAGGGVPDPRLLEAPPTAERAKLKGLLIEGAWGDLLEAAEQVVGTAHGRGWLDVQRYTVTACERLGAEYHPVAVAVRDELRALLREIPSLPELTLMDDTPTANAETCAWLAETVLAADASPRRHRGNGRAPWGGDVGALAEAEVRQGRPDRAVELLTGEVAGEASQRGRFLRQTELATVMVHAGLESVAVPILEEMLARADAHKLEEWEAGDVVAQPLALLYRCLGALGGDPAVRQALYLRLCRLDPVRAIALART
jgi:type VI secretion system protein ImpA